MHIGIAVEVLRSMEVQMRARRQVRLKGLLTVLWRKAGKPSIECTMPTCKCQPSCTQKSSHQSENLPITGYCSKSQRFDIKKPTKLLNVLNVQNHEHKPLFS